MLEMITFLGAKCSYVCVPWKSLARGQITQAKEDTNHQSALIHGRSYRDQCLDILDLKERLLLAIHIISYWIEVRRQSSDWQRYFVLRRALQRIHAIPNGRRSNGTR